MTSTPLALLALATCIGAPALAQDRDAVAVLALRTETLPSPTFTLLNDLLVYEIDEATDLKVISPKDIDAILGHERLKDSLRCDDVTCAAEIAGALGARYLVSGSATLMGTRLYVTLSLIDSSTSSVAARSKSDVDAREDLYEEVIRDAAQSLLKNLEARRPAPRPDLTSFTRAGLELIGL